MFVTRLISGVILLAIMIGAVCLGGPVLYAFLLVISLIGMFELFRAAGVRKDRENLLTVVSYAGAIGFYVLVFLAKLSRPPEKEKALLTHEVRSFLT
jgi:phosphatidate cytidylyltransferase